MGAIRRQPSVSRRVLAYTCHDPEGQWIDDMRREMDTMSVTVTKGGETVVVRFEDEPAEPEAPAEEAAAAGAEENAADPPTPPADDEDEKAGEEKSEDEN